MSATFQNLGFEISGAAPGLAASWTLASQASAEEIAGYGSPELPAEDFERAWSNNEHFLVNLPPTGVEPALYSDPPASFDGFETGWSSNETFLFELGSIAAASYGAGAKLVEDFEDHWAANQSYRFAFADANLSAGPLDGFESGWRGNQTFLFSFGSTDIALGPTESFESGWTTHMTTV